MAISRAQPLVPLMRSHFSKPLTTSISVQSRAFNIPSLSSFTPQFSAPPPRSLSASRTLSFPPLPLFRMISAVESYRDFLPFLTASTVTARDRTTGYPTQAYLTVGYGPLSETFHSKVECDESKWTVGARSGEIAFQRKGEEGKDGGLFEYLDTIWKLEPLEGRAVGMEMTKVNLSVNFRFRNAMHAAMMSAVENQVAGLMIESFEKRVIEVEGRK
ncbi:Coenzyme Q-binding protein coq10, mitochondrial [Ophidiomyces ophidiicola]|uniref:Coenzyme Q-binding protein coq10, mitochondrial n=1 Tax=Ophidiomyces ophidiicola TaxID=1387563 RepID=A0ACB8V4P6_9EURO|nr:Coenzyme Q-binding protein coq10, mitochondrial [Ophidiomyces ophidiicola]KAI1911180.1 Coenzyme Q-binding protein coq10, mitochondrial [Ophidiomyces ophidiicola]KAI1918841.1 Coenzyme Q-binding protein coq10, mitochondrial [Ophidiomyces ophidiicola]KAI1923855.1 Coenzyme Q-binding protein coq10, mitochondrial [Ophidiomyces ophidiicola]KAI1939867.1 Coenzyme Q-binding protein coq10, mitochondrial [Ophidiomyces ophidiicola]KAI1947443.1 Coenzyme Q-binding protein coq10, mitochondrial [Ophidiomyce